MLELSAHWDIAHQVVDRLHCRVLPLVKSENNQTLRVSDTSCVFGRVCRINHCMPHAIAVGEQYLVPLEHNIKTFFSHLLSLFFHRYYRPLSSLTGWYQSGTSHFSHIISRCRVMHQYVIVCKFWLCWCDFWISLPIVRIYDLIFCLNFAFSFQAATVITLVI